MVERGLLLMESKGLLQRLVRPDGFYYSATELALVFLDSLTNEYLLTLRERAKWAVDKYKSYGDTFFAEIFNHAFDRWSEEFQIAEISIKKAS